MTAPTQQTIREYCDGELPADQAARIETLMRDDPALAAQVDFDRRLRERLAGLMDSPCPADLRERLQSRLAADAAPQPWWRGPARANMFAVAASLSLVAGAILFGILGRPIDTWRGAVSSPAGTEVAAAAAGEHVDLATGAVSLDEAVSFRTTAEAEARLGRYLEHVLDLTDAGYAFLGASVCRLPHCEKGCHLLYKRTSGPPGLASLHIVPGGRQLDLRGQQSLGHLPMSTDIFPENSQCLKDVLVWNHGQRCYMLVVCHPQDAERVAGTMQAKLKTGNE